MGWGGVGVGEWGRGAHLGGEDPRFGRVEHSADVTGAPLPRDSVRDSSTVCMHELAKVGRGVHASARWMRMQSEHISG